MILHGALAGLSLLFYHNAGKLNNSAFDAPYLGLPTFKYTQFY